MDWDLKKILTNLLDSDLVYLAGMLLEKCESTSIIWWALSNAINYNKFDFRRSDYVWFVKTQNINVIRSKVRYFCIQQELSKYKFNLIPLKNNNKSKSLSKKVAQVLSCQLFRDIFIKSKNIVSSRLLFQKNGEI